MKNWHHLCEVETISEEEFLLEELLPKAPKEVINEFIKELIETSEVPVLVIPDGMSAEEAIRNFKTKN